MTNRLKEGDIIIVSCVLTGEREYPVTRIEGNKAITGFRNFNTKVWPDGCVYEFGKRANSTTNGYWKKESLTETDKEDGDGDDK